VFNLNFKGLCSYNKLNLYIICLSLFLYLNIAWFILIIHSIGDFDSWSSFKPMEQSLAEEQLFIPPLLIFGVYPLLLSIHSFACLLINLICSRDYASMTSWHRNSFIRLFTNMIYAACVIPFFAKLVSSYNSEESLSRSDVAHALIPICVLSGLMLCQLSCVYHRNAAYQAIISLCFLLQFVLNQFEEIDTKFVVLPTLIAFLTIDVFYLKISTFTKLKEQEGSQSNVVSISSEKTIGSQKSMTLRTQPEVACSDKIIKLSLVLQAIISILVSLGIYAYTAGISTNKNLLGWSILIKSICMVPFITFEYYLIMFEHIFVDASHFSSSLASSSFLDIEKQSPFASRQTLKKSVSPN
jgi:hypothetical protein